VVYEIKPKYPKEAVTANVQGSVHLEVTIDKDGRVTSARVLKRVPESESQFAKALDDAALEAAKQWRFEPGDRAVATTIEMTFTLRKTPPRKKGLR
jgi:protein TonB